MKLVTFIEGALEPRPGLLTTDGVVDLAARGFKDAIAFIAASPSTQVEAASSHATIPLDRVRLLAPIPAPPRIFAIGVNYAEHAAESKTRMRDVPTVFMKLSSAVIGPGASVVLPHNSSEVDYEAELAVVIAKAGFRIPASQWQQHVFGYSIMNDVSARDVQRATSQWTLAKSFPTFAPLGPWIVSSDEIADPHELAISLTIGDERLQSSNTSQLIYKIPALIEYLSSIVPLEVGDVISTGTPAGVGLGRTPQRWLKSGEEMVIAIDGIGELRNPIVAE